MFSDVFSSEISETWSWQSPIIGCAQCLFLFPAFKNVGRVCQQKNPLFDERSLACAEEVQNVMIPPSIAKCNKASVSEKCVDPRVIPMGRLVPTGEAVRTITRESKVWRCIAEYSTMKERRSGTHFSVANGGKSGKCTCQFVPAQRPWLPTDATLDNSCGMYSTFRQHCCGNPSLPDVFLLPYSYTNTIISLVGRCKPLKG